MTDRVRWRITLDELAARCGVDAVAIDRWARLGALGPRLRERRDRGWASHITREQAQRAVVMSRLIAVGLRDQRAAEIAATHRVRDATDLVTQDAAGGVVSVSRANLP